MDLKEICVIHDNEVRAGTWLIAQGFNREHKKVVKVIQKYQDNFNTFGLIPTRKYRSTGGRPVIEYLLNEGQTIFLGSLLKNNEQVIKFKLKLAHKFIQMKRVLENIKAQHKDIKWLETRKKGKVARLESTDEIKEFKTYAIEQGSTNADWYYTNLTKMLNSLLFIVDGRFVNLRDMMTPIQLLVIAGGDLIIKKALKDGMKKQIHYKEIYRIAKERVEIFTELHGQSEIISKQLSLFDS